MIVQLLLGGLLIALVWLGFLSYSLKRMTENYLALTKGNNRLTLDDVLGKIIKDLQTNQKDISKLISRCDTIEKNELSHIQKIGLLRFNPFKDTGGDQSFILSLMDAHDTGVVITALYSRSGTRWYAKRVIAGKGAEHELSDDEKRALKMGESSRVKREG